MSDCGHALIYYLSTAIVSVFIIILVLINSVNDNIITTFCFTENTMTKLLLPQGWAFFTKKPNDYQFNLYTISENQKIERICGKNFQLSNFYGLKKHNRVYRHLIGRLTTNIEEKHWYTSNMNVKNVNLDSINIYRLKTFSKRLDKNKYLIQFKKPLPYTFFKNNTKMNMLNHYIIIKNE